MQLSLAAYSFREFFKDQKDKVNPAGTLDIFGFIDYCAEQGVAGAELTSYFFPKDVNEEYLLKVRRHAFLRGVAITGTAVGNNFALPKGEKRDKEIADVKKWIDYAAIMGAPHIRIFAGASKEIQRAESVKLCVEAIVECCEYAAKKGVFLGLENHGGIVLKAEELLEVVGLITSPWFGVNFDSGNFHSEDPYAELAQIAPYTINAQIKVEIRRAGAKTSEPSDLPRVVKILRDANYQGWVALEYEAKEDPWKAVPKYLAQLRPLLNEEGTKTAENWEPLFDGKSLAGWTETKFAGQGEVSIKDGLLILAQGGDLTGVNLAKTTPKIGYEVSLEAMRMVGGDFFCGLTLPYRDSAYTIVIGGWGGALVGLSCINGDNASENETTQHKKFENNHWYKIRVRATEKKIEAWIDDEQMIDLETDGKTIAMRPGEIELQVPFGLSTFQTQGAFKEIKLRKL